MRALWSDRLNCSYNVFQKVNVSSTILTMVAFHENDGNHENDEDDKDNSDSYKQGVECWIRGNHRNNENDENHGNPGCKPLVPQTTALEIPENSCSGILLCILVFWGGGSTVCNNNNFQSDSEKLKSGSVMATVIVINSE